MSSLSTPPFLFLRCRPRALGDALEVLLQSSDSIPQTLHFPVQRVRQALVGQCVIERLLRVQQLPLDGG
jgi:hypothetical protein